MRGPNVVYRLGMRRNTLVPPIATVLLALAGCSSGASEPPVVVGTVAPPAPPADVTDVAPTTVEHRTVDPLVVDITVVVEAEGIDTVVSAELDPASLEQSDPFGTFASCSGGHRSFGPYSVLVSTDEGDVAAARLLTTDPVPGPGIYDADVRVELRSGVSYSAIGTVTIGDGLRSGSFTAFGAGGDLLSGSFECRGGEPSPQPLTTVDEAGVLDSVEVAVLLRRDGAERVLGVAIDTSRSEGVVAECPAVLGGSGPSLVRIDGDTGVAAITTFELTDGDRPTVRFVIGGSSYAFGDVTLDIGDPPTAGTFSATADGVSVDGAFRCT
jgi:hypothetical protein